MLAKHSTTMHTTAARGQQRPALRKTAPRVVAHSKSSRRNTVQVAATAQTEAKPGIAKVCVVQSWLFKLSGAEQLELELWQQVTSKLRCMSGFTLQPCRLLAGNAPRVESGHFP